MHGVLPPHTASGGRARARVGRVSSPSCDLPQGMSGWPRGRLLSPAAAGCWCPGREEGAVRATQSFLRDLNAVSYTRYSWAFPHISDSADQRAGSRPARQPRDAAAAGQHLSAAPRRRWRCSCCRITTPSRCGLLCVLCRTRLGARGAHAGIRSLSTRKAPSMACVCSRCCSPERRRSPLSFSSSAARAGRPSLAATLGALAIVLVRMYVLSTYLMYVHTDMQALRAPTSAPLSAPPPAVACAAIAREPASPHFRPTTTHVLPDGVALAQTSPARARIRRWRHRQQGAGHAMAGLPGAGEI